MSVEPPDWPLDRPSIGWVCSYTPEEIVIAAGCEPHRLAGTGEPVRRADAYLHANLCPFVRSIFDQILDETYDLDGIVLVNSCDAMRRLHDVVELYIKPPFSFILDMPRSATPLSVAHYADQLRELMAGLCRTFGGAPDEQAVWEAISTVNHTRALLQRVYELRKANPPSVSGSEALLLVTEAARSPKADFNRRLEGRLAGISTRRAPQTAKPRLMLSGSIIDQTEIMELIEENGHVVVEDLCTSHRYLHGLVEATRDPYEALAQRYLQRAPCSRMIGLSKRIDYVKMLIAEYGVQGVIYHALKFCDQFQYDYPHLKGELDEMGVPLLYLEGDYTVGSFGQLKTRVQAFIEMLGDMP